MAVNDGETFSRIARLKDLRLEHRDLDEAVRELKGEKVEQQVDPDIKIAVTAYIPAVITHYYDISVIELTRFFKLLQKFPNPTQIFIADRGGIEVDFLSG